MSDTPRPKMTGPQIFGILFFGFLLLSVVTYTIIALTGGPEPGTTVATSTPSPLPPPPIAEPTATPRPKAKPKPRAVAPAPKHRGLGISRSHLASELPQFTLEQGEPVKGQENYVGRSDNGLFILQAIGDADDLSEISFTAPMKAGDDAATLTGAAGVVMLLRVVAPGWDKGAVAVGDAIDKAMATNREVSVVHDGRRYTVTPGGELGMVVLTIGRR